MNNYEQEMSTVVSNIIVNTKWKKEVISIKFLIYLWFYLTTIKYCDVPWSSYS